MKGRAIAAIVWTGIVLGVMAPSLRGADREVTFQIVVHPDNHISEISKSYLADIYFKRVTTWKDGREIVVLDQTVLSPVREVFSLDVLGRTPKEVRNYWQRQVFMGDRVPPLELRSDEQVLEHVLGHPGAIGYVSATGAVEHLRTVPVVD